MSRSPEESAYARAGVDIDAQDRALKRVKSLARSTFTRGVLTDIGSFGGLFLPDLAGLAEPVLVASADGVGTKLMVARRAGDFSSVGRDLVNHCVNDILVQGARPLFFLDYVGAGVLEPDAMVELVSGVAAGCRENECALLGGETAEMPGFYQAGDYELAGFIIGLVDRSAILDGGRVEAGDALVAFPSSGLHTNGYSLVRRILFDQLGLSLEAPAPWLAKGASAVRSVGQEVLAPHRSYLPVLRPYLDSPELHGLAHITGGGLTDNLPRMLPDGCRAEIDLESWRPAPLFDFLGEHGGVDPDEMFRIFNMGVGLVAAVAASGAEAFLDACRSAGEEAWRLGSVLERRGGEAGVVYRTAP
ncbi:MAG: phosphoribosylformylglycinamidine cyclo-ligase [Acidobacteriota bacterium]